MKNKILIHGFVILIIMAISTPTMAFYSRGKVFKDISYEHLEINKKTGKVTCKLINNSASTIKIFVKAQFCNIHDEYFDQVYIQKTIPPRSSKKIRESLYNFNKYSLNAHHINWYVRFYKIDTKVIINRLGDVD
ncbi:hypothetical protein [Desulfobacter latus]|uniref:Uncharacterized protein n=1 Tax=Desulfobacter latus TaxID=2292 RepID=A0A850TH33_9BACT|nr:hypothetical protein [Desulfobacter latus]NWH06896.1 hypothetical protein [Desulfobacter latus]